MVWLAVFRVVATSVLLLTLALRRFSSNSELTRADSFAFTLVGFVYVLTLGYAISLRRGNSGTAVAYAQVLGDVVLATSLVFLTGAAESPFTFTYSIAVITAAVILFQNGALVAATASTIAFSALVLGTNSGLIDPIQESQVLSPGRLAFVLSSNGIAQFLIAILASFLSRQVAAAGGRVMAREARIQQLVDLQNQIVAAMPSGLITCEASGEVTFVNPVASAILGVDAGSKLAIEQLLPGALAIRPGTRRAELTVPTSGGERVLGLTVTRLDGRPGASLVVFQDLTELRRTEEQLRVADHLASLGKLSAQLAHEIRNPLASMRGAAQLLAKDATDDSSTTRLAGILMRESDRLSALVEDFLRFARPPPPKLKAIDLGRLVVEAVEILREDPLAHGVQLTSQAEPQQELALGDPDQLRQVLINLVRNALAAAGQGGRVRVSARPVAGQPTIIVWDSAGKIPKADLVRIFEPFYTTREGGTGLGLSTAHSIIRSHGGRISVRSAPEAGTEFEVSLQPSTEILTDAYSGS